MTSISTPNTYTVKTTTLWHYKTLCTILGGTCFIHTQRQHTAYMWERVKSTRPLLSGSTGSSRQYKGFMQGSAQNGPSSAAAAACLREAQSAPIRATTYPLTRPDIYNSGKQHTNSSVSSGGMLRWLDECDTVSQAGSVIFDVLPSANTQTTCMFPSILATKIRSSPSL